MLTPIQVGLPGAPELVVILLILLVPGAIVGWLVYRDARDRGSDRALLWGIAIAVLFPAGLVPGLLGVVIYLLVRRDHPGSQVI